MITPDPFFQLERLATKVSIDAEADVDELLVAGIVLLIAPLRDQPNALKKILNAVSKVVMEIEL